MRFAIFSDVHGNLTALKAVLAHIDEQKPDGIVFAGDLCLFGSRPNECVDLLRDRNISGVYGNADEYVFSPPVPPDNLDEKQRRFRQMIHDTSVWTRGELTGENAAWLEGLPFERRVSPTANLADDILVVHANPLDVSQVIYPTDARQIEIFGEVQESQDDEALTPLLGNVTAAVLAFGHLHVPNVRRWRELTLANISSASLPGDGDTRAKYGLLTWDENVGWSVEHQYVSYDVQEEIDALAEVQMPGWESQIRRWEK